MTTTPVRLDALLGAPGAGAIEISALTEDSRRATPGCLFAALPGLRSDGRDFIGQAVAKGAVAVLVPRGTRARTAAAVVEDETPRRRFAQMAANFYDRQPGVMAAVTGTNGKTSVASFARQLWLLCGRQAASLGTLGVDSPVLSRPGGLTSPDPVTLHALLAELAAKGVTHAVCEASSHGLSQYRLDGVRFAAAAFTNLTRDHLDYHATFEAYFYAKARLFGELLADDGTAVIDIDVPFGQRVAGIVAGRRTLRVLHVGHSEDADLRLVSLTPEGDGQALAVSYRGRRYDIDLPLVGAFQAANALLAAGLVIGCGGDPADALSGLSRLAPVPGRLEKVGETEAGARVYVDYAHTPAGLEAVLTALRAHTSGRLVVVFGCGGERDRGKRPEMGRIATALADRVIVTDDNPRGEDPEAIRREILAAAPDARDIGDRAAAIREATAGLAAGDILVVAGKGHETGQVVGEEIVPFSDIAELRSAIGESAP